LAQAEVASGGLLLISAQGAAPRRTVCPAMNQTAVVTEASGLAAAGLRGPMVRTFFVVNPAAGGGKAQKVWARVRPQLDEFGPWACATTERPGHAAEVARTAATEGYQRVVAVGGDGTLSEVVHGLVGTVAVVGLVPGGSANDFARSVGLPSDPVLAAEVAMLGRTRPIDVGEIRIGGRSRYFINVAGLGFDAEVLQTISPYPKGLGATVPYVLGILKMLWRYRPVPMELILDGNSFERKVLLAAVANGKRYGGGMLIAPDARDDDGVFDVCVAGDVCPIEVVQLLPKIYSGGHRNHPKVEFFRCRELQVRAAAPVGCQVDGDLVGHLPARFLVHPARLLFTGGKLEAATARHPEGSGISFPSRPQEKS
jgi:diacylglycerol kinase (ATP)